MTAPAGGPAAAPDTTPPAATPPAPAPAGTATGSEGGSLAERVDAIENKIEQLVNTLHGKAADHTAARLDRGSDTEDLVRREIERGRAEEAERQRQAAAADQLTSLATDVAKLKEAPPVPPVRRIERFFWPGKG